MTNNSYAPLNSDKPARPMPSRFRLPPRRPATDEMPPVTQNALPQTDAPQETGEMVDLRAPTPVLPVSRPPTRAAQWPGLDVADDVYKPAPRANPVVEALIANGLYIEHSDAGLHRIICPWSSEHAPDTHSEATFVEPDFERPVGYFRCNHEHSEARDAQSLIDHLGITPEIARAKAVILMQTGETHRAVAASERVLASDGRYFNAFGPIVRVVSAPGQGIVSELVNDQTLSAFLASRIDYYKKARGGSWERCDPPTTVIQSLRYCQDRRHLQPLAGLSRQPFYGSNGQLVCQPGYDQSTGIYSDFDELEYSLSNPTRDAAEVELDYLKWLLREFEFGSDADRSAALAAILTAAVRPSLRLAPAFNINAPRSGGGKSFLASLISLAASPSEPNSVSYPTTAEEATKLLLSMLLEKPAVILFDDMQAPTGWKALGPINKVLTSATITERVLGRSKTGTALTNVLFLGTGNNVEPGQDMRRRVVSIRLAPRSETPTLKTYAFNPVSHIRKHRSRIVQAALTIIEAHRLAGQPVAETPPIGSYEDWSLFCRQPLIWLGEPDPATSLIEQVTHDTDQDALEVFLRLWTKLFDDDPTMVRSVVNLAGSNSRLRDILSEIDVMDGNEVNTKRLGWYLRKNRGRWAGGLRIVEGPKSQRNTWRVIAD